MGHFVQLLTFRRIPPHVLIGTLVASIILSVGMLAMGQPLYLIALYGLLPWAPVFLFESLWKVRHYHWIAIFAVVSVLQIGHVTEHVVQVGTLMFTQGDVLCPPPVDTPESAARAVEAGLRDSSQVAAWLSASVMVRPDASGNPLMNASGGLVSGPPACGIFGQLDLEIVHLVWEAAGWLLILLLLSHFPYNRWLWLTLAGATIHTFEHLFIGFTFFFDQPFSYEGTRQLWGTLLDGNIVTAYPLGTEPATLTFYDVAGRFGLLAKNGLVGSLIPELNAHLPTRPFLHLYYNGIVTGLGLIAFAMEVRRLYDRYARWALPALRTQEMVAITPSIEYRRYKAGQYIIDQGQPTDHLYVVTRGKVLATDGINKRVLTAVHDGAPDSDLVFDGRQKASVRAITDVEVMRLTRQAFDDLGRRYPNTREAAEQALRARLIAAPSEAELTKPLRAAGG